MIKTSTQKNIHEQQLTAAPGTDQEELFYESIKSELNMLVKNPASATIESILDYSRNQ